MESETQTVQVRALHILYEDTLRIVGDIWETTTDRATALGDSVEIVQS